MGHLAKVGDLAQANLMQNLARLLVAPVVTRGPLILAEKAKCRVSDVGMSGSVWRAVIKLSRPNGTLNQGMPRGWQISIGQLIAQQPKVASRPPNNRIEHLVVGADEVLLSAHTL